ncbi:DEAD/DEAH box helicase [Marinivivus vitaminiproducens]|uniref:DEAD/DEAH box helicase n=1 Tax=Marinivivus vitaminiproducens TaxID=3035935 RepID=UPI00279EA609|nr:DEAD/DEAH box helicase [Geminicoccaceae bacterium SCSIO 64248]
MTNHCKSFNASPPRSAVVDPSSLVNTGNDVMRFSDLGLSPELLRAVEDAGYVTPTPIQAQAIPVILQRRDVLGIAQTGTGKTASFSLPMIDLLASGRGRARMPRSLILSPVRELATQTAAQFDIYGKHTKLSKALLIGGVGMGEQERTLASGVDVLIATPGRLLDQFERGKVLLGGVEILVIDEADRMLDMGFIPDVERLVSLLAKRKQTLLFSATMPKEIRRLAEAFLHDPVQIQVAPVAQTTALVEDVFVPVNGDKEKALLRLLGQESIGKAIIFSNRKRSVATLKRRLDRSGLKVLDIHGDLDQSDRQKALEAFKAGRIDYLVATDVAARGLDISQLPCVVNYDVPFNPDDYVHRIGRTGRAGHKGHAYTMTTADDAKFVQAILAQTARTIPTLELASGKAAPAPAAQEVPAEPPAKKRRASKADAPEPVAAEEAAAKPARKGRPKKAAAEVPAESAQESAAAALEAKPARRTRSRKVEPEAEVTVPAAAEAETAKPVRRRRSAKSAEDQVEAAQSVEAAPEASGEAPAKPARRVRPKKAETASAEPAPAAEPVPAAATEDAKPRRGRPRKAAALEQAASGEAAEAKPARRGRPRKVVQDAPAPVVETAPPASEADLEVRPARRGRRRKAEVEAPAVADMIAPEAVPAEVVEAAPEPEAPDVAPAGIEAEADVVPTEADAEAHEPAPSRRSRRGRRRRGGRGGEREAAPVAASEPVLADDAPTAFVEDTAPTAEPAPAEARQPERESRRGRGGERRPGVGNRAGAHRPDEPVVGLGDHVPSFLLRPVPVRPAPGPGEE